MKYWIIPSNSNLFRMEDALSANNSFLDWRCKNMAVGDIVFIYKTRPYYCIKYMMEVVKVNFSKEKTLDQRKFWIDYAKYNSGDGIYNRFKLLKVMDERRLSLYALRQHGVKGNIQSKRECHKETLDFILSHRVKRRDEDR